MARLSKYSPEVRERAVRMVLEHRDEHDSLWAAVRSIAQEIGGSQAMRTPEELVRSEDNPERLARSPLGRRGAA